MNRVVLVVGLGLGLLAGYGCSSDSAPKSQAPDPIYFGANGELSSNCSTDADCPTSFCLEVVGRNGPISICTRDCSSDADCGDGLEACGTSAAGRNVCVYSCPSDFHYGFACPKDAVAAAACGTDQSLCQECGCPDALRCEPGVGCMPKSEEAAPCHENSDCKSGNCSPVLGICRVPVGSACTKDNCDLCQKAAGGYSFCNRDCDGDSDCNGSVCLIYQGQTTGICYQKCSGANDASCPGTCKLSGGNSIGMVNFCDCASACTIEQPPLRPLGAQCVGDGYCASNDCYSTCVSPNNCRGWCSALCTQDTDCGSGSACVNVPCVDDEPCGATCVPTCGADGTCASGFTCRELGAVGSGTKTAVCDVKLPDTGNCTKAGQCQSGLCFMGACVPPGGDKNPNGGSCQTAADCASANCVAGKCKGKALLGDACVAADDCAAGMCCTSGAKAGKCDSSCR
jgi:hypothetical protein